MRLTAICLLLLFLAGCRMSVFYASKRIQHETVLNTCEQEKPDFPSVNIDPFKTPIEEPRSLTQHDLPVKAVLPAEIPVQKPLTKTAGTKNFSKTRTIESTNRAPKKVIKKPAFRVKNALILTGMILLLLLIMAVFAFTVYIGGTLIYTYGFSLSVASLLFFIWLTVTSAFSKVLLAGWINILRAID